MINRDGAGTTSNMGAQKTNRERKSNVQTLAEALHMELAPRGVDVLASAPGPVRSGFADRARMKMNAAETPETVACATVAALGNRMTVTPGTLSKFLTWSLMTTPLSLHVRIMGKIIGGMTAGLPWSSCLHGFVQITPRPDSYISRINPPWMRTPPTESKKSPAPNPRVAF